MKFYDKKEKEETKEKNNEEKIEINRTDETKKRKIITISICVAIALIILFAIFTGFALFNINNTNIISKISVNGIDIGELSREEAENKLYQISDENFNKEITLKAEEFEYKIKLSQIEAKYEIDNAIEEAIKIGRNSNIFVNNYEIAKTIMKGTNLNLGYKYNQELLENLINNVALQLPNAVIETTYKVENNKLIIEAGKKGNSIDKEKVKQEIIDKIINSDETVIEMQLIEKEPDPINIDKIHEEVFTEAKDAYYVKEPFQVFPHVNGIDFDVNAAKELLKESKEQYQIDLKITVPDVTTDEIGNSAFPDLLGSFTTKYDTSNAPRTTNLKIAMSKLNGVVVNPGEVFSYNKTLGKRTVAAGYKEAGGYAGGKVVQTLAGGICQISSTLYDAVIYANLEIVERHNHMFLAGYVGAGKDATVVYGNLDFKFKNTRKYPIMIKTAIGNGVAKIDIFGIKEEVEYDVEIVTTVHSYTPFRTIYEDDNSLAPGQEKVSQNGMNGCRSTTYKVVKLNGAEISRTVLSKDVYDPMNKIIKRGPQVSTPTNTQPQVPETPETVPEPESQPQLEPEKPQPETPETTPEEVQPVVKPETEKPTTQEGTEQQ